MLPVIILAGGLGTRLKGVLGDLPKPLALVAGKPFLIWLLKYLQKQDINEVYISVGSTYDAILNLIGHKFENIRINYLVEDSPLGTGGAIFSAIKRINYEEILVFNGDTLSQVDIGSFVVKCQDNQADIGLSLCKLNSSGRYGRVEVDSANNVIGFAEKTHEGPGFINAGIYYFRNSVNLINLDVASKFSFENDFLPICNKCLKLMAFCESRNFIDIGVPEDLERAQVFIPHNF